MFWALVRSFLNDEGGQNLSEYCLLTAFIALVALAIFIYASGGIGSIWNSTNSTLSNAAQASDPSGSHN